MYADARNRPVSIQATKQTTNHRMGTPVSSRPLRVVTSIVLSVTAFMALGGCPSSGSPSSISRDPAPPTISDLKSATDEVARMLIRDLETLSREDFQGKRVGIVMGELVNRAAPFVTTGELEQTRTRLVDKLAVSGPFRDNFVLFRDRAAAQALQSGGRPKPGDPLGEASGHDTVSNHQIVTPEYCYSLAAELDGIFRPDEKLYTYRFVLVRDSDHVEVWRRVYEPNRPTR